jgi:hypothetical protein
MISVECRLPCAIFATSPDFFRDAPQAA